MAAVAEAEAEAEAKQIKHGTYTGYQQHRRHGVPICDECREAVNVYGRDKTVRAALAQGLVSVPLEVLGRLLVEASAETEEWVESVIGATRVEVSITAVLDDRHAVAS